MIASLYPQFQRWSEKGSVYIISDTHFDDLDCTIMNSNWPLPKYHMDILKTVLTKNDVLLHLGDVGNPAYLDELKCYKVLIAGNHDRLKEMNGHFNEIYNGPLFIADRILLSHEPIYGLENFCLNLHGHQHCAATACRYNEKLERVTHINFASDVIGWDITNLKDIIKAGYLSKIPTIHRMAIEYQKEHSLKED